MNKINIGTIDWETQKYYYRVILTDDSIKFQDPVDIDTDYNSEVICSIITKEIYDTV